MLMLMFKREMCYQRKDDTNISHCKVNFKINFVNQINVHKLK